jgi:predicted SnoaL-like aldol condensation-catalyzing enzyme
MDGGELVTTAITEAFIDRNLGALERYWSPDYVQHSPRLTGGVDSLRKVLGDPEVTFTYEIGAVIADGDLVAVHARVEGLGPEPMIVVDLFRIEDGKLVEHWDVMQPEVPVEETASKTPMWPAG